jgi:hypothetical protein
VNFSGATRDYSLWQDGEEWFVDEPLAIGERQRHDGIWVLGEGEILEAEASGADVKILASAVEEIAE